jgi:hypothetical protein
MDIHRDSARTWRVKYHPTVQSVEISSGLEQLLKDYASLDGNEWVMSVHGRSIDRIIQMLITDIKNPERDVSFGELDLTLFKSASTR